MPRHGLLVVLAPLLACAPPIEPPSPPPSAPPSAPRPIAASAASSEPEQPEQPSPPCYSTERSLEWDRGVLLGALRADDELVILTTSPDPRVVRRWNEAEPEARDWLELPLTGTPLELRGLPALSDPPALALSAETSRGPVLLEIPPREGPISIHSLPEGLVPIVALRGRDGQLVHVGRSVDASIHVVGPAGRTTLTATCPSVDGEACVVATSLASIEDDQLLALRILSEANDHLHLMRIEGDGSIAWERELDDLPLETAAWGPGEVFGPALLRVEPTRVIVVHATSRIFVRLIDPASGTTRAIEGNDPPSDSWQTAWTPLALVPTDEGYAIVTRHLDSDLTSTELGVVEFDEDHAEFGAPEPLVGFDAKIIAAIDDSREGEARLHIASALGESGSWTKVVIDPKCAAATRD